MRTRFYIIPNQRKQFHVSGDTDAFIIPFKAVFVAKLFQHVCLRSRSTPTDCLLSSQAMAS